MRRRGWRASHSQSRVFSERGSRSSHHVPRSCIPFPVASTAGTASSRPTEAHFTPTAEDRKGSGHQGRGASHHLALGPSSGPRGAAPKIANTIIGAAASRSLVMGGTSSTSTRWSHCHGLAEQRATDGGPMGSQNRPARRAYPTAGSPSSATCSQTDAPLCCCPLLPVQAPLSDWPCHDHSSPTAACSSPSPGPHPSQHAHNCEPPSVPADQDCPTSVSEQCPLVLPSLYD